MLKMLINQLENFHHWGWRYYYSLIFPVYFQQDVNFKNGGFDIITIRRSDHCYFHGTIRQCALLFWK